LIDIDHRTACKEEPMKPLRLVILVTILGLALTVPCIAQNTETLKIGDNTAKKEKKCTAYTFKFSGYIKADYSFDDARVYPGNFAIKVLEGPEDEVTNITARETRIGLDFFWGDGNVRTDAKLEFDFYGLGASPSGLNSMENKAAPMLRHAYLKVSKGRWAILAGQTSDVISPLVPRTVNYTVGWAQGNIGYRRPQFRVSAWTGVGSGKLTASIAATRTLGHDIDEFWISGTPDSLIKRGDGTDDGADSPLPTVQGRLGFEADLGPRVHAAVGASGHYGREEARITTYDIAGNVSDEQNRELESWSFNIDAKLKLSDRVTLTGEYFMGQNLGTYFGGVLQDYSPTYNEIGAQGGWGVLSLAPSGRTMFNMGYCFDDPDDNDFTIPDESSNSMIGMNSVFFGNVMYDITSNVTAMIEGSFLKTTYLYKTMQEGVADTKEEDYDSIRIQFALKAAIL
jgi:hypothetical protein